MEFSSKVKLGFNQFSLSCCCSCKLQLKLLGTPLSMCSCSRCCSFCVFSFYVLWLWAFPFCVLLFWALLHYLCSCFERSSFCDFLLLAILALCAFALDIPLYVLLLWAFLALCALAFNIPHFVNFCSQHSSLYVFWLLASLTIFRVVGGSCC